MHYRPVRYCLFSDATPPDSYIRDCCAGAFCYRTVLCIWKRLSLPLLLYHTFCDKSIPSLNRQKTFHTWIIVWTSGGAHWRFAVIIFWSHSRLKFFFSSVYLDNAKHLTYNKGTNVTEVDLCSLVQLQWRGYPHKQDCKRNRTRLSSLTASQNAPVAYARKCEPMRQRRIAACRRAGMNK